MYYANNIQNDKPILVMQTNGGNYEDGRSYCWTRDLPVSQSQILVDELSKKYKIYHVTRKNGPPLNNVERVDEVASKSNL